MRPTAARIPAEENCGAGGPRTVRPSFPFFPPFPGPDPRVRLPERSRTPPPPKSRPGARPLIPSIPAPPVPLPPKRQWAPLFCGAGKRVPYRARPEPIAAPIPIPAAAAASPSGRESSPLRLPKEKNRFFLPPAGQDPGKKPALSTERRPFRARTAGSRSPPPRGPQDSATPGSPPPAPPLPESARPRSQWQKSPGPRRHTRRPLLPTGFPAPSSGHPAFSFP